MTKLRNSQKNIFEECESNSNVNYSFEVGINEKLFVNNKSLKTIFNQSSPNINLLLDLEEDEQQIQYNNSINLFLDSSHLQEYEQSKEYNIYNNSKLGLEEDEKSIQNNFSNLEKKSSQIKNVTSYLEEDEKKNIFNEESSLYNNSKLGSENTKISPNYNFHKYLPNSQKENQLEQKNNFTNILPYYQGDEKLNKNNSFNNLKSQLQENNKLNIIQTDNIKYPKKKKEKKDKVKLGRKDLFNEEEGEHDKNFEDNLIRKSIKYFGGDLITFLNTKIIQKKLSVEINGKKYKKVEILKLGPTFTNVGNVKKTRNLFKSSIKDIILNTKITKKYKRPKNYNKYVVDEIYKNKDCNDIKNILDLKYIDCLKYYKKDISNLNCLKGLEKYFDDLPLTMRTKFELKIKNAKKKYGRTPPKYQKGYDIEHEKNIIDTIKKLDTKIENKKSREKKIK